MKHTYTITAFVLAILGFAVPALAFSGNSAETAVIRVAQVATTIVPVASNPSVFSAIDGMKEARIIVTIANRNNEVMISTEINSPSCYTSIPCLAYYGNQVDQHAPVIYPFGSQSLSLMGRASALDEASSTDEGIVYQGKLYVWPSSMQTAMRNASAKQSCYLLAGQQKGIKNYSKCRILP